MVAQGFDKLGYDSIHMDDCVSAGSVPLRPSSTRSPRVHFAVTVGAKGPATGSSDRPASRRPDSVPKRNEGEEYAR